MEDPEHVPLDAGRITWTVTPVNGTPGNPNREKIMRSPAVLIGGLYWNIKYYPRGNDGTENMSVYIECSPSPRGGGDSDEDSTSDTSSETDHRAQASNGSQSANEVADVQSHRHTASGSPEVSQPAEEIHINSSEDRATTQRKHWEAAAQIGCVVYNPSEPRVHYFRRSSHRFIPDNADWGWTRFHGPWESIHLRQRNERQALLRNDTLVFTAYIRTVTDDTRALWWHAPKQAPSWDCYERIGVKSLATGSSRDNAIIAAISCWLHLKPFVDFIMGMKIPDALREPQERNRPLFHALQQLLEYMFEKPEDTGRNAMINVAKWIDWYITESYPPRLDMPDVVAVWESLRRILNYEASGMGNMATAPDCFQDVLLLRQPDPWATESPLSLDPYGHQPDAAAVPQTSEPRSVQETIDLAASSSNPFRPWQCFSGNSPQSDELPAVLHIELHRQMYDKKARRWDKLTHRIQLNENITYTSPKTGMQCGYTLFGMVVHSGALESHDFNSIIRPHGPGTRWIRYSGGNFHREAACLTTTQAVTAHEGKGEQATGSAAVAYIVLYIRTDSVLDILLPPSPLQRCMTGGATLATASDEADSETPVSVRVYNSTLFDSYAGRGLPDLWALNSDEKPDMVREFHVPRSITLDQISRRLDSDFLELKKVTSEGSLINGWHYIETGLDTNRGLPRLVPLRLMDTVERAIVPSDGCRLWFHSSISKEPTDNTDTAVTSDDLSAETHQTHTGAQADVDEFADTVMSQEEQLELPARVEVSGAHNGVPDASASPIHETSALPAENVPPAHPSEQEQEHGRSEDAIMEGTQEPPAAADPDSPRVRTRSAHRIYFFVKVFDSQTQNLRAVCSHETFFDCNVHNSVLPLLGSDNTFDIYMERSRLLSEHDRVRSSSTFDDLDLSDGCIFIAHRRPSPEE